MAGPTARLCWEQAGNSDHCDRREGHAGNHSWDLPGLRCEDCGIPHSQFPMDLTVTPTDWALVHPEGESGVLCSCCVLKRARVLPKIDQAKLDLTFVP